jgi:hypothetical protein
VVLLAATVVLTMMYRGATAATKEAHAKFDEVIETEIRINTYDVGPTESNVRKAEENIGAAEKELGGLMTKVSEVFPPLNIKDMKGVEVKNELDAAYKEMNLALSEGRVENAVASFGFEEFEKRIPNSEERKMVLRQLRVVQAMVGVVAESGLASLESIERPVDLPMLQHDLFEYYSFKIGVAGEMESIRRLLNGLHTAKLCLVVRNVQFQIEPPPMSAFGLGAPLIDASATAAPDPGIRAYPPAYEDPGTPGPAAVEDAADEDLEEFANDVCTEHRVVWRETTHVEATVHLDYIEFRQDKKQDEE